MTPVDLTSLTARPPGMQKDMTKRGRNITRSIRDGNRTRQEMMEVMIRRSPQLEGEAKQMEEEETHHHHPGEEEQINLVVVIDRQVH